MTWERFLDGPTTLGPTPGERERWHGGRRTYAVWVLRAVDERIVERIDTVRDHLAPHGLGPAPDPHVTIFVAGFPTAGVPARDDDVGEESLDAQREALVGLPSPRLHVGGANAFLSCVFLEVHGDLERLRAALGRHAREVRFAAYVPHVTVGAFTDERPVGPVAAALEPLRHLPPIALHADAVELVEVDALAPGPLRTRWRVALS